MAHKRLFVYAVLLAICYLVGVTWVWWLATSRDCPTNPLSFPPQTINKGWDCGADIPSNRHQQQQQQQCSTCSCVCTCSSSGCSSTSQASFSSHCRPSGQGHRPACARCSRQKFFQFQQHNWVVSGTALAEIAASGNLKSSPFEQF